MSLLMSEIKQECSRCLLSGNDYGVAFVFSNAMVLNSLTVIAKDSMLVVVSFKLNQSHPLAHAVSQCRNPSSIPEHSFSFSFSKVN